jgi:hypothetical protein
LSFDPFRCKGGRAVKLKASCHWIPGAAMAPVCFVVMGFGKKIDLATGRELDLDKSYTRIIRPAVQAAGYQCIRADEVQQSGTIDVPMYKLLYEAELVIADLSTTNPNAIFELGIRHALKPRATIVIAESKFSIPFDATHIAVRRYEHLGSSIDYDEAIRMQILLTGLINALPGNADPDSPVYTMLPDLRAPTMIRAAPAGVAAARAGVGGGGVAEPQAELAVESYASKLQTARDALNEGAFGLAKKLLEEIYKDQTKPSQDGRPRPARPFVVQQLALATYKAAEADAKTLGPEKALIGYTQAEELLRRLDVETTTDPETLGLWSSIHKRRAEMPSRSAEERKQDLDEAIGVSERGFLIKRDYYNGTNLAYLYNLRASLSSGDDRLADNVFADRVRRMVLKITDDQLATLGSRQVDPAEARPLDEERYWIATTKAETLIALGDPSGENLMKQALANAPAQWMAATTKLQLSRLQQLLQAANSPSSANVEAAATRPSSRGERDVPSDKSNVSTTQGPSVPAIEPTPLPGWLHKKNYYVSYAWADSANPEREKEVDRLCDEAEKKYGVFIIRDKTSLKIGDLIYDFMRNIGEGDLVFVFLSDKYLHSSNCMFELSELWRNNRQLQSEFRSRVRLFNVDGVNIYSPRDRLQYTSYWISARDELKETISKVGAENAGYEDIRQLRYMQSFVSDISNILAVFAGAVQPKTFEEFIKYGFSEADA